MKSTLIPEHRLTRRVDLGPSWILTSMRFDGWVDLGSCLTLELRSICWVDLRFLALLGLHPFTHGCPSHWYDSWGGSHTPMSHPLDPSLPTGWILAFIKDTGVLSRAKKLLEGTPQKCFQWTQQLLRTMCLCTLHTLLNNAYTAIPYGFKPPSHQSF